MNSRVILLAFAANLMFCQAAEDELSTHNHIEAELEIRLNRNISTGLNELEVDEAENGSFQLVLVVFLLTILILLFVVLMLVNAFVCDLLKSIPCFTNDSICLFVNRQLDVDWEETRTLTVRSEPNGDPDSTKTSVEKELVARAANYYGVEETEEACTVGSESRPDLSSNGAVTLGSFKNRTFLNNPNQKSSNSSNTVSNISSDATLDEDLRPVFYELDELEKRLSESLSELVKIRNKSEIERINKDVSVDGLTVSLINSSDVSQDLYATEH